MLCLHSFKYVFRIGTVVLRSSIRLLCWISISATTANRTNDLKETWGKRCDVLVFKKTESGMKMLYDSTSQHSFTRNYQYLRIVKETWKQIYDYHTDDADWFLATVDDTYINFFNYLFRKLMRYLSPTDM